LKTKKNNHHAGSQNSRAEALPAIAPHVRKILEAIGEDPDRPGLSSTPRRVEHAYRFFTSGYSKTVRDIVGNGVFEQETDEMVIVKDIELYSLCEHHMVPFFGKAHVAYLPSNRIIGLSKIARIVDLYARRLQVQERLTTQVAHALQEALAPLGVGVVIEAAHLCMMMRGVEKQNSVTVTSCMLGRFRTDEKTRTEFLTLALRARP
jgi:GTP cyclohydrolase I